MPNETLRSVHVAAGPTGRWTATAGSGGATEHGTQAEAIKAARASVAKSGGQVSVRDAKGRTKTSFTLGRQAMETLNAVEGVTLSGRVREAFSEYDRKGLDPEERRSRLLNAISGKKG